MQSFTPAFYATFGGFSLKFPFDRKQTAFTSIFAIFAEQLIIPI